MKNFKKKEWFILSLSLTIVFITVILLKSSYAIEEPRILTIKNTTESLNVEEKVTFDYLIELDDQSVTDVISDIEFVDGKATVSLEPNDEISISFDADYKYKVTPLSEKKNYTYSPTQTYEGQLSIENPSIITYTIKKEEVKDNSNNIEESQIQNIEPITESIPTDSATVIKKEDLEEGGHYVIFRVTGGKAYILTGKGNAKEATTYESTRGGKITWPADSKDYKNIIWEYHGPNNYATLQSMGEEVTSYLTLGNNTYNERPVGTEPAYVNFHTTTSPAMRINNGNFYLNLSGDKKKFVTSATAASLYLAKIDEDVVKVSFDATNGGESMYTGAGEINKTSVAGNSITVPTEEEISTPQNYNYKITSWIDIDTGEEITPGTTITPTKDTVYYANYQAKDYNFGIEQNVVNNTSTNDFITTKLYDINDLFNLNSAEKTQSRDYDEQKEIWSLKAENEPTFLNQPSLGLVFFDTSKTTDRGKLSLLNGRNNLNANMQKENGNQYYDGIITPGIQETIKQKIFNENTLGVNYVGTGDYLYQFDEDSGYYYYDSNKNAASYNQKENRFYVYDYTYGTSKSEGEDDSDFLPFNYMSKEQAEQKENLSASNGYTNYWFAMESNINFILPDDAGSKDQFGNYQNRGLKNNDMIFKFTGDDDMWVYVDDELILDLGGVHDVIYGEINFSTGVATIAQNGAAKATDKLGIVSFNKVDITDNNKIQQYDISHIKSGNHTLKIYYVERGASQSNAGIYFNVSDKYKNNAAIEVSKKVEGKKTDDTFTFNIKFEEPLTGQYGQLELLNGEGTFSLKDGETIDITNLPSGAEYQITEVENENYDTTVKKNETSEQSLTTTGKLIGGSLEKIEYTNKNNTIEETPLTPPKEETDVPNTYDNIYRYILIFVLSILGIGTTVFVIKTNKKNQIN